MAGLISNGSYVLGDPNTRDLYLGKGLKDGFDGNRYYIATDETVLFESQDNVYTNIVLSESVNNFERVIIFAQQRDAQNRSTSVEILIDGSTTTHNFCLRHTFSNGTNWYDFMADYLIDDTGANLNFNYGVYFRWSSTDANPIYIATITQTNVFYIRKVIGINRKRG